MSRNRFFSHFLGDDEPTPLQADSVLLIGLGRFGSALGETLMDLGSEVLAIDTSTKLVQEWSGKLTDVREADATSVETMRQLGAADFDVAVVAIGSAVEASILATSILSDLGVKNIWAKAIREDHGRILQRVGAHHVVFPEKQMGARVAHAVSGQVVDYFQLDEGFVLAEIRAKTPTSGGTLQELNLRERFGITVVCIKQGGRGFTYATPDTHVSEGDLLVIAGTAEDADRFASYG